MKLADYEELIKDKICKFCKGKLGPIEYYKHEGGYEVEGFKEKQWLYATCFKCDHQWSLVHLGIKRGD